MFQLDTGSKRCSQDPRLLISEGKIRGVGVTAVPQNIHPSAGSQKIHEGQIDQAGEIPLLAALGRCVSDQSIDGICFAFFNFDVFTGAAAKEHLNNTAVTPIPESFDDHAPVVYVHRAHPDGKQYVYLHGATKEIIADYICDGPLCEENPQN